MLRAILACALCAVGSIAFAAEFSPKARRVIEQGEIRRRERLTELEGGIQILKARMIEQMRGSGELGTGVPANAIAQGHTIQKMQDRIDVVMSEIHAVKTAKVFYPNIVLTSLHPGDIGILVDPFGVSITAKVTTIIDEKNMIVTVDSQSLWLAVNTKGLKVGKQLELTMPFEVMGTATHKSVEKGSKKIFVLQPFYLTEGDAAPKQAMKGLTERNR